MLNVARIIRFKQILAKRGCPNLKTENKVSSLLLTKGKRNDNDEHFETDSRTKTNPNVANTATTQQVGKKALGADGTC
jgi:hypothetical protein